MSFRFAAAERPDVSVVTPDEQAAILHRLAEDDGLSCCKTLHIGLFFDGTRNNAERDAPSKKHSNVARLRDVFAVDKYHRVIYVAGVGTPFVDEVGDYGSGLQAAAGAAAGWAGEGRINWALLQIHNLLHEYVHDISLSVAAGKKDKDLVKSMSADMNFKGIYSGGTPPQPGSLGDIKARSSAGAGALKLMAAEKIGVELEWSVDSIWAQLKGQFSTNWVAAMHAWDMKRRQILNERRDDLKKRIGAQLAQAKPKLQRIRLSVFGFSRGSAEARTFSNWLVDALDANGGGSDAPFSLAGVPVSFDFLGIFDTVASVGIAQGTAATAFDGHGGWGRKELMAVPSYVRRCVHMVAAHEPRGSFPLDLIDRQTAGREEVVYPGVHSDVGGGYGAGEQGKGKDDADKLSQVPLLDMYREARKSGVPLDIKGPGVAARAADAFKISPGLKQAFSAYVKTSANYYYAAENGTPGLMRAHYGLYLRWRRMRLADLKSQACFKASLASYPQDATDLDSANVELKAEWDDLADIEKNGGGPPTVGRYVRRYADTWVRDNPMKAAKYAPAVLPAAAAIGMFAGLPGLYGGHEVELFLNRQLADKWQEWLEVKSDWYMGPPEAPISALYDNYMHDSRAWFKPFGADDDAWNYGQIQEMKDKQAAYQRDHAAWQASTGGSSPSTAQILQAVGAGAMGMGPAGMATPASEPKPPLTAAQTDVLNRYDAASQAAQKARAAKDPSAPSDSAVLTDPAVTKGLALQNSGREFYFQWGYLRWRTVYINGERWVAPHVPTAQEDYEAARQAAQMNLDTKGLGAIFQ
ncbi:DUF2235 domain-containing protein [Paraburkholderia sp. D15]|uniref:T6SS phospholipase effector Tle1-like catalytic domain-containing protein n=1 Tax=Paraburkholderia sp. D15 TaxID=2880218 RepID=UPI0024787F28|nr:DUF2235 domain-containing protein [Paraburkholderia sp. D15]WGS49980.1 DUF2235 domain-containing protein [Paraburkholderia sp. D15]WKF57895.1 hypothetical protein HUO10_002389 [Paraburkholderia busanensis]